MTSKDVTVEKQFGEKTVSKTAKAQVVETDTDVLTLLQEDASAKVEREADEKDESFRKRVQKVRTRVIRAINYSFDLWKRAELTGQLNSENVDPDKALDKATEQFMKFRAGIGKPITVEQAKAILSASEAAV